MRKLNVMEMRNVEGGAKYAYCPVCGARKKLKWTLAVLFLGWNQNITRAEAAATLKHAHGGSCGW